MDAEVLQKMISEYRRKIETYQSMVAEWEKELGTAAVPANFHDSAQDSSNEQKGKASAAAGSDFLGLVREWEFFQKSQPEAARAFLEKVGHPVKTQTILEALVKGGVTVGGKDASKKMNLYTILHRSQDFALIAKDTWGLVGWPGVAKKEKESNGDTPSKKVKEDAQEKK